MSDKQDRKIRDIVYEIYGVKDVCPHCGSADIHTLLPLSYIGIFMPVKKCGECKHEWFYKKEIEDEQEKNS